MTLNVLAVWIWYTSSTESRIWQKKALRSLGNDLTLSRKISTVFELTKPFLRDRTTK